MSIYPVRIKSFFPPVIKNSCKEGREENKNHRQTIRFILEFMRCLTCNSKVKMRNGWIHHSVPWGYGDAWCSKHCVEKK